MSCNRFLKCAECTVQLYKFWWWLICWDIYIKFFSFICVMLESIWTSTLIPTCYTQSPFIRTTSIRLDAEILGKFKTRALGSSNLRTTSKNLRTTRAQIFKAKNGKKWKPCQFSVNSVDLELWHLKLSLYMKCSAKNNPFHLKNFLFFLEKFKNPPAFKLEKLSTSERLNLKNF